MSWPSKLWGRVKCGYSRRPAAKLSSVGRGLRRPARRGSAGQRPRSGPWRRSRPRPARNRPGEISSRPRASITRWSRPSNRPQSRIAPGPAASARTRAWVSGAPARREIDERAGRACRARRIDRRRRHIGPHHHAGPAAGRRVVDACDACPGRARGYRAHRATRDFSPAPCPSSETPSGPGNISGNSVRTVARPAHSTPARSSSVGFDRLRARATTTIRPLGDIDRPARVSRVKASSTIAAIGARDLDHIAGAEIVDARATVPSTRPSPSCALKPDQIGMIEFVFVRSAASASRATNSSVPFSASAALRSSMPSKRTSPPRPVWPDAQAVISKMRPSVVVQRAIARRGVGRFGEGFHLHLALQALRADDGAQKDVARHPRIVRVRPAAARGAAAAAAARSCAFFFGLAFSRIVVHAAASPRPHRRGSDARGRWRRRPWRSTPWPCRDRASGGRHDPRQQRIVEADLLDEAAVARAERESAMTML